MTTRDGIMSMGEFENWFKAVGLVIVGYYMADTGVDRATSKIQMIGIEIHANDGRMVPIVFWSADPTEIDIASVKRGFAVVGMGGAELRHQTPQGVVSVPSKAQIIDRQKAMKLN